LNTNKSIVKFNSKPTFNESNVYRLSELKPAATKLILEPNTDLIELLKLTLFDLALKQVLIIKKTLRKSHPRDPHLREYVVVETGKNYARYSGNKFEEFFTERIDEESYFQLKVYLREIYKDIPTVNKFKNQIISDLSIKNLFRNDIISSVFSIIKTNTKGNQLKKDFEDYLSYIDDNIGDLINNEPEKVLQILLFLQGNIFLLKNLKFELLESLKLISVESLPNNEYLEDWLWLDFMLDIDFDFSELISDISEMFDSIDEYFDFESSGDWDGDFDFDFD
jgi:hypothetical protein